MVATRTTILACGAIAFGICATGTATAQGYPTRPITMIVPFAAGGPTDSIARILGDRMRGALGQPVIIENVTGAGGTIGVGRLSHASPDGYTIGLGNWATHVVNGAIYALKYNVLDDFDPVSLLPSNSYLIVTNNAVPARNLKELISWLKANPDRATAGTAGAGSGSHVTGMYFQKVTGTRFQFVPYRGGAGPVLQDLIAGHIDMAFDQIANSLQHVRDGQIRAYAITAKTRFIEAPEIPTVDEAGLPELYASTWFGLWAPRGTPNDIIAKLNTSVVDTLLDPAVRRRLIQLGLDIPTREQLTPEALGVYQKAEIDKWWPIIKASGIKGD